MCCVVLKCCLSRAVKKKKPNTQDTRDIQNVFPTPHLGEQLAAAACLSGEPYSWLAPPPPSYFLSSRRSSTGSLHKERVLACSHLALALGLCFDTSCHLPALWSFLKGPQASPGKQVLFRWTSQGTPPRGLWELLALASPYHSFFNLTILQPPLFPFISFPSQPLQASHPTGLVTIL